MRKSTEEKRNPVEEEPRASTSRDDGGKKSSGGRKRKAPADDPTTALGDDVKAKLKVKLSSSKSSKKKKSSKESKSSKRKPSKEKKAKKNTAELTEAVVEIPQDASVEARSELLAAEVLQADSAEALAELPVEFLQTSSIEAPAQLPAEILEISTAETCMELPADILQVANVKACSELPVESIQTDNIAIHDQVPSKISQGSNIEVCSVQQTDNVAIHDQLPSEILQVANVEVCSVRQTDSVEMNDQLPAEVLMSVIVEVQDELPTEAVKVAGLEVHNEPPKISTSKIIDFYKECPEKILEDANVEVKNDNPLETLLDVNSETSNNLQVDVSQLGKYKCRQPLQSINGENHVKLDLSRESSAIVLAFSDSENESSTSNYENNTIKTKYNRSGDVILDFNKFELATSVLQENINYDSSKEHEKVNKNPNEAVDVCQTASNSNTTADSNIEGDLTKAEDTITDEVLLGFNGRQEPELRKVTTETTNANHDSLKEHDNKELNSDQNTVMYACKTVNDNAVDICETASNGSIRANSDSEGDQTEAEDTITDEVLLGFNSRQEPELIKVTTETINASHDSSKEHDNKELNSDQNTVMYACKTVNDNAMDICETVSNSSTRANSDSEGDETEAEDTKTDEVLLGFNSRQEPELRKITTETTNANHDSSKEHDNKELNSDQNGAICACEAVNDNEMDTCEIASNSSTKANSDNERNRIEAKDTVTDKVLLSFNSREELELRTVVIETANVSPDSLKQEYEEMDHNLNEAMETCEDIHNYKQVDLVTYDTVTNVNSEFSNEHRNKDMNHDQNDETNVLKDTGDIEEIDSPMAITEANLETFNKQTNKKVSEEQNEIVDLHRNQDNQKHNTEENEPSKSTKSSSSKSSKSKSSKSKSKSKSSKSSSSRSSKSKLSKSSSYKSNSKPSSPKSPKSSSSKSSKSISKKRETVKDHSKYKNTISTRGVTRNRNPVRLNEVNEEDPCRICEQLNSELKFYSGEPANGYEEELAIIDSRLLLFNGDEENVSREDTRAYNKLTSFRVYCKKGHLCPFDSGLIEKDVEIYFSGYVKPIYSDDPSIENGVPGKDFGPIVEWWTTGFDIGEQPTVAFSTEVGDYVLMEPAEEYKPFMQSVLVKSLISKIVIEYLVYEPHATYEDLLNKLENTATMYDSLPNMSEDVLLQHAPFICMQVMSYDETAKPNESLMLLAPCIRRLIDLAGISFKANTANPPRHQYHKRRAGDYRKELLRKLAENRADNSSTSKLIDSLLPGVDKKLIALSKPCTRNPCGSCDRCQRPSCKECETCMQKNYEKCLRRRCFYREILEANDEDTEDSVDLSQLKGKNSLSVFKDTINIFTCFEAKLSWLGKALKVDKTGDIYYTAVKRDKETIRVGDFVFVRSVDLNVPPHIVKVAYMWKDKNGLALFHANHYWWGRDTILGELAHSDEVFSINKCSDMSVNCITEKVTVYQKDVPRNQNEDDDKVMEVNQYYCEMSYEPSAGYFHDLPDNVEAPVLPIYRSCINCEHLHQRRIRAEPEVVDKLEETNEKTLYRAIKYKDEEYIVGSCVYLKAKSLYFQFPMLDHRGKSCGSITKKMDEVKYPEIYRKAEDNVVDSKFDMPAPFDIGQITEIFSSDKLYVRVRKLYRPENTHRNEVLVKQNDINMLYWSNEVCTVAFSYVIRKCYVAHLKDLNKSVEEWSSLGPDRFYYKQMYVDKTFTNIDNKIFGCENVSSDLPINYPDVNPMTSLEIFAGCGGLSLGLRDAGIIQKSGWAIENDIDAANTFKINNPTVTVFEEHPDVILANVINGEYEFHGSVLPHKGDVEFLCATLPCENYKDMTDISIFKHSCIATFLSYCDHYKPLLFILDADEKLIKRSVILKLTLACFVSMGYQVTFDLMQVGSYGAPQNRRRSIILGATPGYLLPKFPQRLHVFPKSLCQLGIVIDSKKYKQETFWTESAPYRSVTVRDALIDLPTIKVGSNEDLNYDAKSAPYFAKMMRLNMLEPTVFNHVCKDLGPLVECRITQIPQAVGSDWRNLPNIEIQLRDGSFTKKLVYNYDDVEGGKSSSDALRGVCGCASGGKCNPRDRQHGCLIPWHLVHSAKQNNQWAGIYSRLQWDGFFNGAITNPQPLGTQGSVLHPSQPRPVSVRECARAQGFPDDFLIPGTISIHDMYRVIGRATSPLLGRAIGHEIARSLTTTHSK